MTLYYGVGFNNFFSDLRGIQGGYFQTFAIGHFALGYIAGKGSSKLAKVKLNLPLLLAASVLPDLDLLLSYLLHRGLTHSLIFITALMVPFFVAYRKQAIPYYAALLSHTLIGDFFTGGAQLLWPLSQSKFGVLNAGISSLPDVIAELALFVVTLPIMYKLGDLQTLLKPHNKNWALTIPFGAVLGPLLPLDQNPIIALLSLLLVPSLFYLGLFAFSMLAKLSYAQYYRKERARKEGSDHGSGFEAYRRFCFAVFSYQKTTIENPRKQLFPPFFIFYKAMEAIIRSLG